MKQRSPKTGNDRPSARAERHEPFPFNDAEELTAAAQALFAREFANPQRLGCPPPGTLQTAAQTRQLPAADLRAHLFGCSECFNEYRAALLAARPSAAAPSLNWRDKLAVFCWSWRRPLLFGALVLLALGWGVITRNAREKIAPQISQKRPQPLTTPAPEPSAPTAPGAGSAVQPRPSLQPVSTPKILKTDEPGSSSADLLSINIDLNDYSALPGANRREGSKQAEQLIQLPRARVLLKLKLPRESAPGLYQVKLLDDYLKSIAVGQIVSADNRDLVVKLDLRRLSKQFYHLSLTQGDQAPYFYRIVLTAP